ncbi:MAG: type II toxin-antitoxin system RelE/ParE family toxin [Clostridiales bacterium]|nr:type II toxin-antitoxin system RelE/ParE family toxin [Clostridiales bacterium]
MKSRRNKKLGYRRFVVGDYIILYSVNESNKIVLVERVFHTLQDYKKQV